jgi:hypothetical protein
MTMRRFISWCVAVLAAGSAALLLAGTAGATGPSVSWDHSTGISGPASTSTVLATLDVPADEVGQTCKLTLTSGNNASVHVGNKLTAGPLVLATFEDAPNVGQHADAVLVMPAHVDAVLTFGADGISSSTGSLAVSDCASPPPSTTAPPATTTTVPARPPVVVPPAAPPRLAVPTPVAVRPGFTG